MKVPRAQSAQLLGFSQLRSNALKASLKLQDGDCPMVKIHPRCRVLLKGTCQTVKLIDRVRELSRGSSETR